jgi:hypothetical protein
MKHQYNYAIPLNTWMSLGFFGGGISTIAKIFLGFDSFLSLETI